MIGAIRPYLYGALGIFVACIVGIAAVQYAKAQDAETKRLAAENSLAVALGVNEQQAGAITRLTSQRAIDDRLVSGMLAKLDTITAAQEEAARALSELEEADPDVKTFLATPLPDGLRKLFNGASADPRP